MTAGPQPPPAPLPPPHQRPAAPREDRRFCALAAPSEKRREAGLRSRPAWVLSEGPGQQWKAKDAALLKEEALLLLSGGTRSPNPPRPSHPPAVGRLGSPGWPESGPPHAPR